MGITVYVCLFAFACAFVLLSVIVIACKCVSIFCNYVYLYVRS